MALTATRSNLRRTVELDIKVKWLVVSVKIDRIYRISNISDAKLFPTRWYFCPSDIMLPFSEEPSFEGKNTSGMLLPPLCTSKCIM